MKKLIYILILIAPFVRGQMGMGPGTSSLKNYNTKIVSDSLYMSKAGVDTVYKHQRGESEYTGNGNFGGSDYGVGTWDSVGTPFVFNQIACKVYASISNTYPITALVYLSNAKITSGTLLSGFGTFLDSVQYSSGIFNTSSGAYQVITLPHNWLVSAGQYIYIIFYSTSSNLKILSWGSYANISPERRAVVYTTFSAPLSNVWYLGNKPSYMCTPPKFILNHNINNGITGNINTSQLNSTLSNFVGILADSTNPYRVLLPDSVYLAGDREFTIYFDNLLLGQPSNTFFNVVTDSGAQFQDWYRWMPALSYSAIKPLQLLIYNWNNNIIGNVSTILKISDGSSLGTAKSLLAIGDSRTADTSYTRGGWVKQLKILAGTNLTCLGTQGNLPYKHEGYAGKTITWFVTHSDSTLGDSIKSPFSKSGHVDFQNYLTAHSYSAPNYVIIRLGTNDIYSCTDSTIITTTIAAQNYLDSLILSIHAVNANTLIGVVMETPPAYSQDGFGITAGTGQTTWQYKRNIHYFIEALKTKYGVGGTKALSYVSLIAAYLFLDTKNNMKVTSVALNAYNSTTYSQQSDGIHELYYNQIADAIFGWLKNH